ncbi:MAG: hypothetical protein AAB589_00025 [Patescibacteria group bacterium]
MKKAEKKITLESLAGKVETLSTKVTTLSTTMAKGFKEVNKSIEDLARATAKGFAETATKEELRGVTEQLSSLENRLAEVELISR